MVNAFNFNTATFKTIEIQEKPKHFMHGDLEPSRFIYSGKLI